MLTYCLDASAWTDVKLHGNFYGSWADIAGSGSNNNWSFTIDGTKMTGGSTYEFGLRCENGTEFYASSVTFNFSSSATQSQTIAKANSGNMKFVHNATYTSYSVRVSFASEQWTISISGSTSGGGGGDNAYYLVIQDGNEKITNEYLMFSPSRNRTKGGGGTYSHGTTLQRQMFPQPSTITLLTRRAILFADHTTAAISWARPLQVINTAMTPTLRRTIM